MQRLCAVANRIVSSDGKVSRIEVDLLMDDLRRLYDVALDLRGETVSTQSSLDDEALMSSTMMATRAAMGGKREECGVVQPQTEDAVTKPMENVEVENRQEVMDVPEVAEVTESLEVPETTEKPNVQEVQEKTEVLDTTEEPGELRHIMAEVEEENSLMFDEVIIEDKQDTESGKPEVKEQKTEEAKPEEKTQEQEAKPKVEEQKQDVKLEEKTQEQQTVDAKPEQKAQEQTTLSFTEGEPVVEEKRQPSLLDYLRHTTEEAPTVRTIGDTLRSGVPVTGMALERKVSDLRTVININDKFSFMTELFRGNMKAYNDFIMQLNGMASRDEAMSLVEAAAAQYHWEEDSIAVRNFYKVFDKKF